MRHGRLDRGGNMSIADLVKTLTEKRIELSVKDGRLRYRAVREALDTELLAEIRRHKAELIEYFHDRTEEDRTEDGRTEDDFPLSHSQEALWFLYELDRDAVAYSIAFAARLSRDLDVNALKAALHRLHERHEMLRTRFGAVQGAPYQRIARHAAAELTVTAVDGWSHDAVDRHVAELADQPFDLESGPVVRWHLLTGAVNGAAPTPMLLFVA